MRVLTAVFALATALRSLWRWFKREIEEDARVHAAHRLARETDRYLRAQPPTHRPTD